MRNTLFFLLIIVIFTSCKQKKEYLFHNNLVIAHRGAWKNTGLPQNSLSSLHAAIDLGCHGSEMDVHLTADDSLIVYHDKKHHGFVIDSTDYADLVRKKLHNGEEIPTLRMYLSEVMKQNQTKLIIDIKTPNNKLRASQIAEKALKLVEQMNAEPWVEFLTGELAVAQILINKTTLPVAYLGTYSKAIDQMKPEYVSNLNLRFIDYRYIHFKNNQKWIKSFKKMNFYTNAWVVNEEEDMEWFINQDFDYITTDEPELLLKICNLNEK